MFGSKLLLRPSGGYTCTSLAGAVILMGWLVLVLMVLLCLHVFSDLNNSTEALRRLTRPVGPVLEPMSEACLMEAV